MANLVAAVLILSFVTIKAGSLLVRFDAGEARWNLSVVTRHKSTSYTSCVT